ncbi:MAG: autotransporter domain-containing protein [Pseudomonadota bacterium]
MTVQNLDSVTGQAGDGLNLVNEGVAITVSGIGTITGTGGNGILADTIDGTISIQSVGLVGGVTGTGDFGILATGAAIDIGGVSAVGDVSGSVAGISAVSTDPGDVTINTSAGAVSGGTNAISVTAVGEGDLSVTTADLTSEAAEGLSLSNSLESGDIVVNTAAGTVEGGTFGIALNNQGTGTTSITTADVTGTSQTGISAVNQASAVDLEINSSAGSVTGALDGIQATNLGTGALTIITANVAGMADDGVLAFNSAAATDLAVDASAGTVSAIDLGVSAINQGSGTTAVTTADVTSANGTAIEALSVAGDIAVDTSAGAALGGERAIDVQNTGAGSIDIVTANATGTNDLAIMAYGLGGNIAINTALGDVAGVNAGVAAMQMGTGALSVTTGDVSASAGNAVHAQTGADAGALMINTSAGNAMGSVNGVYASHSGSGDLSVTTALAMGGDNGVLTNQGAGGAQVISVADATGLANAGVSANSGGASLSIAVTGRASGLETGVQARNNGTGALAITVAEAYGTNTAGILARNGDAETPAGTSLSINSTGVVQGATGIDAANNGSGALTITTADVTGTAANAVTASSAGTDLTIDTSAGTLGGQTNGILASNTGSGATTITAADVLGVDGAAIAATNSASASDLNLALSGTVMGNEAGIIVDNAGTGATRITTSGAIMAVSGEAIRVSGVGADVINDGLVMGFVTFGEGDDSFTNNGEFGASANSVFGAGTNVFTNTNLLAVTSAGPVSLEGVTTFANTGTISLVDSQIGNNLIIPGDFNGTGASRLALDFSFNDMQSDVLTIGGAASGSTVVSLNLLEEPGASMFDDILIIDAGAGSEEGAFTLEGGRQQIGLLRFEVAFDGASDDYFVISLPTDEALQTSNFAESARNLWWQSLDAWSNQLASLRNQVSSGESSLGAGGDNSTRVWFTANASEIQRDRVETFTSGLGTTVIDLGYEQDFLGFQGGLDYGNDVLRFGVTGGYLVSEYEFASTSDRIDYDVFNIGAYLTLDTGAFFANALVKYDTINGQFEGGSGFLNGDMDGSTFGARGEVGALIGERAGVFLEPSVSLSWIDANLDDIATAQGGFEFSEDSSLLGRFGARVGKGFGSGKTKGVAYLGAHYVSEFQGDDAVAFTSNGRAETFGARPFEDFVETRAGVTLGSETSPWSGGIEGHLLFGDDLDGYGVSANVRYRF